MPELQRSCEEWLSPYTLPQLFTQTCFHPSPFSKPFPHDFPIPSFILLTDTLGQACWVLALFMLCYGLFVLVGLFVHLFFAFLVFLTQSTKLCHHPFQQLSLAHPPWSGSLLSLQGKYLLQPNPVLWNNSNTFFWSLGTMIENSIYLLFTQMNKFWILSGQWGRTKCEFSPSLIHNIK